MTKMTCNDTTNKPWFNKSKRDFNLAKRFHFNEKSEKYDHLLDILLKRPMALSAQLRNHAFLIKKKTERSYEYKSRLIKSRYYFPLENDMAVH